MTDTMELPTVDTANSTVLSRELRGGADLLAEHKGGGSQRQVIRAGLVRFRRASRVCAQ